METVSPGVFLVEHVTGKARKASKVMWYGCRMVLHAHSS
jgi:hypothetical protein